MFLEAFESVVNLLYDLWRKFQTVNLEDTISGADFVDLNHTTIDLRDCNFIRQKLIYSQSIDIQIVYK